jgi:DNA repair protein RecN (Recombination protein N)
MLTDIQIRNFVIVETLTIDLSKGMIVLTGETGAGKSILLDALTLALGGRADSGFVRQGCERAEISATFQINHYPDIVHWLKHHELDADGELDCIIRRTVGSDGRSKGYINGYPVPIQSLRELGDLLVDIHGQHAHQSLLKKDLQRQTLDDFAGHGDLLHEVQSHYSQWRALKKQQIELEQNKEEREARIDLLTYQTKELEELNLSEEEILSIESEHSKLAHVNQIREGVEKILFTLEENEQTSAARLVNQSLHELEQLKQYDDNLEPTATLLNEANIQLAETINELNHYLSDLNVDPMHLEYLDERLSILHDLSRKHHVETTELPTLLTQLSSELSELLSVQDDSANLDQKISTMETAYFELANKLTASRSQFAKVLEKRVSQNMQQLGMKNGQFSVDFQPQDDIAQHGLERIEFLVRINPGQPFKPMSKVASGGELSRISLALQVIIANKGRIPTLVFDEVDVGIGGGIAEIVGRKLKSLSGNRQVICITHQPQVAALADYHLHVSKTSTKNSTDTQVRVLNEEQRYNEIARMLGGLKITDQTLSHAKEMIEQAKEQNKVLMAEINEG